MCVNVSTHTICQYWNIFVYTHILQQFVAPMKTIDPEIVHNYLIRLHFSRSEPILTEAGKRLKRLKQLFPAGNGKE